MNRVIDSLHRAIRAQIYLLLVLSLFTYGGCALSDAPSGRGKNERMSKVSPELIALYHEYSNYVGSRRAGEFKASSPLVQVVEDRVIVDAVSSSDVNVLKTDLQALGMQHAVAFGRIVSGQLPILAIPSMATLPNLNFARPAAAFFRGDPRSLPPRGITNQ